MQHNTFLLALLLASFIVSCNSIVKKDLYGKWKTNEVNLINLDESVVNKKGLIEELESTVFDFKEDGVILYSNFFRTGGHGNWSVNLDSASIKCSFEFERVNYTDNYQFDLINDSTLILTSSEFDGVELIELNLQKS